MQYGSTAYLGMTQVVSGQFLHIENIWCNAMAKHDREEPKEHHSSTKGELGYTLISTIMPRVCWSCELSLEALNSHRLFSYSCSYHKVW